jgi:CMP-N-acetylneuraminic acid synthetase
MRAIAIIPARGGSKRIPYKNILDFMGKPMIAWTIEAALKSNVFDRVVVSTDDKKIAKIAIQAGAEVPFLREEANDDITPVSVATIAAVKQAQDYWSEEYDIVVQLMANCPIRGSKEIVQSVNHFNAVDSNFQITCFKFGFMNPWWAVKLDERLKPEFIFPEATKKRSQDLPDLYCPTGAIWIAKTNELIKSNTFYGNGYIFFPIDWKSAVDIDNYDDIELAKTAYQMLHR